MAINLKARDRFYQWMIKIKNKYVQKEEPMKKAYEKIDKHDKNTNP